MDDELAPMLNTRQVADELGIDDSRVRQLLRAGRLSGTKYGRDWLVSRQEVERYKQVWKRRKTKKK